MCKTKIKTMSTDLSQGMNHCTMSSLVNNHYITTVLAMQSFITHFLDFRNQFILHSLLNET